jgi:hypothetical protein
MSSKAVMIPYTSRNTKDTDMKFFRLYVLGREVWSLDLREEHIVISFQGTEKNLHRDSNPGHCFRSSDIL